MKDININKLKKDIEDIEERLEVAQSARDLLIMMRDSEDGQSAARDKDFDIQERLKDIEEQIKFGKSIHNLYSFAFKKLSEEEEAKSCLN